MTRILISDLVDDALGASVDEIHLPLQGFRPINGSPADGQSQGMHYWSFPDSSLSLVGISGLELPDHWNTYAVDALHLNPTSAAGAVSLVTRSNALTVGQAPSLVDRSQTVTAGAQLVIDSAALTNVPFTVPASRRIWLAVGRNGSAAPDTLAANFGITAVTLRKVA